MRKVFPFVQEEKLMTLKKNEKEKEQSKANITHHSLCFDFSISLSVENFRKKFAKFKNKDLSRSHPSEHN